MRVQTGTSYLAMVPRQMKTFRTRSLLWEKVCSGRREERDNRSNMASQRAREDPSPPPTCRGEPVPPGPEWEAGIETEEESHGPRTQPRRVTESALSETSPHSPKSSSCASHPATTFRHPPSCDKPCQFFLSVCQALRRPEQCLSCSSCVPRTQHSTWHPPEAPPPCASVSLL